MEKLDITKNRLYIRNLTFAVATSMSFTGVNTVRDRTDDGLIYVTEGGCVYLFSDGTQLTVNPGDVLYLANHAEYRMTLTTPSYSVIYFNFQFDVTTECKSAAYSLPETYNVGVVFRKLLLAYRSTNAEYLCECMTLVYKIYGLITSFVNSTYTGRSAREKMEEAKNYIDRNYGDQELTVERLASVAEVSEVYFRKLFHTTYGINPAQYVLSVRLGKAKSMLENGRPSLAECALLSGFSTPQYFCKAFKDRYGITPAKFAKRSDGTRGTDKM